MAGVERLGTAAAIGIALLLTTPGGAAAAPRKASSPKPVAATPPPATPRPAPSPSGALTGPLAPPAPMSVVSLPLELKDPYTAYSVGMIPFGSTIAARYVGTTRLSWRIDDELAGAATGQSLMDWGLLVGGATVIATTAAMPYSIQGQTVFLGVAAILAIPVTHAFLYAPFWGEQAVIRNRREMVKHGFPVPVPEPTPTTEGPLAPGAAP